MIWQTPYLGCVRKNVLHLQPIEKTKRQNSNERQSVRHSKLISAVSKYSHKNDRLLRRARTMTRTERATLGTRLGNNMTERQVALLGSIGLNLFINQNGEQDEGKHCGLPT